MIQDDLDKKKKKKREIREKISSQVKIKPDKGVGSRCKYCDEKLNNCKIYQG